VKNLRLWVILLTGTSFAAGLALGFLLGAQDRHPVERPGPFADYAALLVSEFDLSSARTEALHSILESYQRDIDGIKNTHTAEYMADIEPGLRELGERYAGYIRDDLIPASERERFDHLCEARNLNLLER